MIAKILVWFLFILYVLNVVIHLYEVSKGEYCKTESPTINAIAAVIDTILACLIWLYLIPLVG